MKEGDDNSQIPTPWGFLIGGAILVYLTYPYLLRIIGYILQAWFFILAGDNPSGGFIEPDISQMYPWGQ